jgi:hypothetical protein
MTKKEKGRLVEIWADLKRLANERDAEKAHGKADDLLCEALILLKYPEIVAAYNEVPGWYA